MISIKVNDTNRVFLSKTFVEGDDDYIQVEFQGDPIMMLWSDGELISDDEHKRYVKLESLQREGLTKNAVIQNSLISLPYDTNGKPLFEEDAVYSAWVKEVKDYLDMFDDTEITQEVINNVPKYPLS